MIANLPTDIDFLIFWEDNELDLLLDLALKKRALIYRNYFE